MKTTMKKVTKKAAKELKGGVRCIEYYGRAIVCWGEKPNFSNVSGGVKSTEHIIGG